MDDTSAFGPAMAQSWTDGQIQRLSAEVREVRAAFEAFRQQSAVLGTQIRLQSLEAALRSNLHDAGSGAIVEAARAYEAYLKGE